MSVNCSSAAIMCPDLANPINGRVTFSPDSLALATVATYNCEPGYGLNSTSVRTCVDLSGETDPVGTWNGDASTCSGWFSHNKCNHKRNVYSSIYSNPVHDFISH